MKSAFGRSAPCTAGCPDSARTGFPGAYQWYDADRKLWCWVLVGSSTQLEHRLDAKAVVQRQASSMDRVPPGVPFRYVFVDQWVRVYKPYKGWRAKIRYVIEVQKGQRTRRKTCRQGI